ncbi:glycosyltransferase [Ancylobacter sp. A5.8]|uniref:glycosyltransferase n=1 Tax=Ancylobacter gelatini TaxID=2919920 RepID=UPI001F4E1A9A|nr:glycosyltransferase [Ancylobacter gelatini]MCJ8143705.1 glycosyltransferase [Ancylobacter gelatini]
MKRTGLERLDSAGNGGVAAMLPLPAEIAGMAGALDPRSLAHAALRAERLGVGADEALLAAGLATPDQLARAAARQAGVDFLPLDETPAPATARKRPADILGMLRSGMCRLPGGHLVIAARGIRLRAVAAKLAERPELAGTVHFTTPERFAGHVRKRFAAELAGHAAFGLWQSWPALSARTLGASRHLLVGLALLLVLLPVAMRVLPSPSMVVVALVLAALLLGWSALRIAACTYVPRPDPPPLRDGPALPRYSLLVPLYREARIVPQLIEALEALDYPPEKLQVLLVVEPDDRETTAALAARIRRPGFDIVVAPALGPRTKPKALNAALAFATGDIVGIYDAEDIPDPQQLRRACSAFRRGGPELACVQARLAIDNLADSWITRQFAAEYAAHFDVVLPMLSGFDLPLPLGGTSNHFRRAALERIGGWDPYNVTEDADLGVRLARHGFRTVVIASTTDEEAPRSARAWLCQRSRWYKGWMQTLLVHGRQPLQLVRQTGLTGALALALMLGGNLAAALMHPFFAATLVLGWLDGVEAARAPAAAMLEGIGVSVFAVGYGATLACTALGMRRRRMPGLWRVIPLVPLYWLLLSCAAWRALFQLIVAPQRWEKTEHGLARTSRRTRSRYGRLAVRRLTNSGADPRRRSRARASD